MYVSQNMQKKIEQKLMKPSSSSHCSSARDFLLSPLLLISFTTAVAIFYCMDLCYISKVHDKDHEDPTNRAISSVPESKRAALIKIPFNIEEVNEGCDIFQGRWVRDYYNRPLYQEDECPYIAGQLTCLAHGRPEKDYQFWRWQPRDCSLPSFDAKLMLEALRGKRLLFAGDSLNRNQFRSLICLLHRAIPEDAGSHEIIDTGNRFTAKEYNATIEFYWAPFLLESNSDDPLNHRGSDRIVRNSSLDKHGKYWKGADILIFNTYIWWISEQRILRNSFEDEVYDIVKMTSDSSYRMAMKTLVRWIESNVDPKRTRTFFASMSPTHNTNSLWGRAEKGNCYGETRMIEDPTFFGAQRSFMKIMDEEFAKSKVPITFLNITQLSSARKEAHTSIYKEQWGRLSEEKLADPKSYADCIHWCLPGVPDTWNELLFAKLFYPAMSL